MLAMASRTKSKPCVHDEDTVSGFAVPNLL